MSNSGDEIQNISDEKDDVFNELSFKEKIIDHLKNSSLFIFHKNSKLR